MFGGEVLRAFSFTFGVGIITGTYSSVFVSSSIVVDWKNRIHDKFTSKEKQNYQLEINWQRKQTIL